MFGLLWPGEGRRVRVERTELAGLRVLRADVPTGRRHKRGLVRACRALARDGVRKVLLHRTLEVGSLSHGLVRVEPGLLYRHMADRLVLAGLARRSIPAERAVVELRGEGTGGELCRTAARLCPQVGQVRICAGPASGRVQESLLRAFGMAADPVAPAVLTVRFDGADGGETLYLSGPRPHTDGLHLTWPGREDGEWGVDEACLLCALWQAGLVRPDDIIIVQG